MCCAYAVVFGKKWMVMNWQLHVEGFITKVELPVKVPDLNETIQHRASITKVMLNETDQEKLVRLKMIRDAYDKIIMSL